MSIYVNILSQVIKAKNFTGRQLADFLRQSPPKISNWLTGKNKYDLDSIVNYLKERGFTEEYLFDETGKIPYIDSRIKDYIDKKIDDLDKKLTKDLSKK